MAAKKYSVNGRELESYQLSNNELVELVKKEQDKELIDTLIGRFEHRLCKRSGEDGYDGVCARFISDMVNGRLWKYDSTAKQMASDHRYLQSEMFKLCLAYIHALAENYDKGWFDPRNQWACETAKKISEIA